MKSQFVGTGKAGGLNADEAVEPRTGIFDAEIVETFAAVPVGIGPDRPEGADHLSHFQLRQQLLRRPVQLLKPLGGGGEGPAQWLSHTTDEQISLHAGDGRDALAAALRLMEDHPARLGGQRVQHQIFGAVRFQPDVRLEAKLLDPVGGKSGAVEDRFCENRPPVGLQKVAVFGPLNGQNFRIQHGLRAVLQGVFIGGDAQKPGIDGHPHDDVYRDPCLKACYQTTANSRLLPQYDCLE